jgi:hypothetical protein
VDEEEEKKRRDKELKELCQSGVQNGRQGGQSNRCKLKLINSPDLYNLIGSAGTIKKFWLVPATIKLVKLFTTKTPP